MKSEYQIRKMYLSELERLTNTNQVVSLLKFVGEGFQSPEVVINEEVRFQIEEYFNSIDERLKRVTVEDVIFGWIQYLSHDVRLFDFVIMCDFMETLLKLGFSTESSKAIPEWEKIKEVGKSQVGRDLAFQEAMRLVYPLAA